MYVVSYIKQDSGHLYTILIIVIKEKFASITAVKMENFFMDKLDLNNPFPAI